MRKAASLSRKFLAIVLLGLALDVAVPLRWALAQEADAAIISEIRVEGNQRIEAATVGSYMLVREGMVMDAAEIDRSLKALFATGLFADVTVRRAGTVLIVSVVENPIVNQLAFEGAWKIDREILESEVQLRPRIVYTRSRVQSDVQRLLQIYRRSGRFAATIEPKVIQLPQNRVDLVFEINEGPLTEIRRISFVGNRRFSDRRLRREVATRESRWWRFTSEDTYDPDRLTFDRELLRRFYLSNGYADIRVVSAVAELSQNRLDFFVTFTVDEGEVYQFGEIDVATDLPELNPAGLRGLIDIESGDTYDAEAVEDTIQALNFEVGRLGYAFVDIRPRVLRNREDRSIDITFEIGEGPRVYIERIDIVGNVRTLDKVIRREFELAEGDAYNTAKLRRAQRQIRGLGFFERVEIGNEPAIAEDRTNITVAVEEKSTGELSIGAGISTLESFLVDLSIRERNLLGKGQDLKAAITLSSTRQQFDISFTEPYFLDRKLAAGFDLFHVSRDFQRESSFDEKNVGMVLRAGYPITENLSQTVRYTLRQDTIENVSPGASRFILEQKGQRTTSAVGYTLNYDLRDDAILPSRGYIVQFGQDLAGFLGETRYFKSDLAYRYYYPFAQEWIGTAFLREGYIFGIGQDVRIQDRYFLGGSTFRGFRQAGVGPRDRGTGDALGGNLYYVSGLEMGFPLGLPNEYNIVGRVFTEVGSLALVDASGAGFVDIGTPRVTAGFGVSWGSPFGPLRLDFGFALVKEEFDETEVFRFDFGTRF